MQSALGIGYFFNHDDAGCNNIKNLPYQLIKFKLGVLEKNMYPHI